MADETRCSIEVQMTSGRAAAVVLRIRADVVEIWYRDTRAAVFRRDELRAWLAEPLGPWVREDVVLSLDRNVDRNGRVAISLPDVNAWTLSPSDYQFLRKKI